MSNPKPQKIYTRFIDGTEVLVPIHFTEIDSETVQILSSEVFDPNDRTVLYEFKPGDSVKVSVENGNLIAINFSDDKQPALDFNQFLFRIMTDSFEFNEDFNVKYRTYLSQLSDEIKKGIRQYPKIIAYNNEWSKH